MEEIDKECNKGVEVDYGEPNFNIEKELGRLPEEKCSICNAWIGNKGVSRNDKRFCLNCFARIRRSNDE